MYDIIRVPATGVGETTANLLEIGDLADVIERGFDSVIVLRTCAGLVALSDPNRTWSHNYDLKVRKLPPDTVLQLRVRS